MYSGFARGNTDRASLVVQWLRIHLAQLKKKTKGIRLATWGTWVQSLVQEDSACGGAIKPGGHNY